MLHGYTFVCCLLAVGGTWCADRKLFPPNFMFGTGSSAHQIEGAWNVGGRSESVWDRILHTKPDFLADRSNADVSCDSYHLWRRDIEMIKDLGVDSYRFSISWPRLLPNGFSNYVNEEGKEYYSNLINGLLENGIEPIVTLYHCDLPQSLQDLGGWVNPLIADWFMDYARVAFSLYADRVKYWVTLNEPLIMCDSGYSLQGAPFIDDPTVGMYLCNKNILLAHAKAWRVYDEEYKPTYFGKVSMVYLFFWFEAMTPEHEDAASLTIDFWNGRYAYPIYSKAGGWPPRVEKLVADNSRKEGYPTSRLPAFTAEEIDLVRGTYDYYGLNHYTTRTVRKAYPGEEIGGWPLYGSSELGVVISSNPDWEPTNMDWFMVYPEGLRQQLTWINQTYGPVSILITENGYPTTEADLDDPQRTKYIKTHLEMVLSAIKDGVDIIGYTVWCLMDNFEWLGGYSTKYGIYAVNFTDEMRTRTPRSSAKYYSSVARSRSLEPLNYDRDPYVVDIEI